MESIKHIGYWKEKEGDGYPMPVENSATPEQVQAQLNVLDAVASKARPIYYKGMSRCRICGKSNGSEEYALGDFRIPEGVRHYVKDHAVLVPGLLD